MIERREVTREVGSGDKEDKEDGDGEGKVKGIKCLQGD